MTKDKKELSFKTRYDNAVWASDDLDGTEKLVALAWAHRCTYETGFINESTRGTTSYLKLAKRTGMTDKWMREVTKELIAKGWMQEVEKRAGQASIFQLLIPTPVVTTDPTPVPTTDLLKDPGTEYLPTPVLSTDNKNDKNVTTKNESKNEALASPELPLDSSNDGFSSDASSLPSEEEVGSLACNDMDHPGSEYRGSQDDEEIAPEDEEWDTVPVNSTENRGAVREIVRTRSSKNHWTRTKQDGVQKDCLARLDVHTGTVQELVDEVTSEWELGDDW